MYPNPYVQAKARFEIDAEEWTNILVSILAITLSLTFANAGLSIDSGHFIFLMSVFAITVGSGFLLHELAHKFVAVKYGAHARYETWTAGLVLMLGLAIVPQLFGFRLPLFLAPGAVMIYAMRQISPKESGLISLAGPMTNIALAVLFFVLGVLVYGIGSLGLPLVYGGITLLTIIDMGIRVNLVLATFNLLPIFPLDGFKVMLWDWRIWLAVFGIAFLGSSMIGF